MEGDRGAGVGDVAAALRIMVRPELILRQEAALLHEVLPEDLPGGG